MHVPAFVELTGKAMYCCCLLLGIVHTYTYMYGTIIATIIIATHRHLKINFFPFLRLCVVVYKPVMVRLCCRMFLATTCNTYRYH